MSTATTAPPTEDDIDDEDSDMRSRALDDIKEYGHPLIRGDHGTATYFPESVGKALPKEGAWVIVTQEPNTVLRNDFRLPVPSMWRAKPRHLDVGAITVHLDMGTQTYTAHPVIAVITTPAGELGLWPHEYVIASKPTEIASDPDSTLNSLGGQPLIDEDQLFYLRSRGIPRHQAVMMLLDTIENTDYAYVTFSHEVTESLASLADRVSTSLDQHTIQNPRSPT